MKKVHIILGVLSLFSLSCSSMQHIVRNNIEGVILSKKVKSSNFFYDEKDRFKPTFSDIDAFENEIRLIPKLDSMRLFSRQYAGFINEKTGNKCLFVIFLDEWAKAKCPWKKRPYEVQDRMDPAAIFDLKTHQLTLIEL